MLCAAAVSLCDKPGSDRPSKFPCLCLCLPLLLECASADASQGSSTRTCLCSCFLVVCSLVSTQANTLAAFGQRVRHECPNLCWHAQAGFSSSLETALYRGSAEAPVMHPPLGQRVLHLLQLHFMIHAQVLAAPGARPCPARVCVRALPAPPTPAPVKDTVDVHTWDGLRTELWIRKAEYECT